MSFKTYPIQIRFIILPSQTYVIIQGSSTFSECRISGLAINNMHSTISMDYKAIKLTMKSKILFLFL